MKWSVFNPWFPLGNELNNRIETEKQRRLQHKIACSKLLSLVVSLLSFPKPSFILTFEQTLKFVMVCIIRYVMYHKIFGVDNDGQDGQVYVRLVFYPVGVA
jgi:hypothetical protein